MYVAGFPCQAFSMAGKRRGFEDTRGTLFFNVSEFIKENQPKCFILENVRGLVSHDKGRTFQTIKDILSNGGGTINGQIGIEAIDDGLGYHIYYKILNTKDYGIPQNRERIFIVGFKEPREFSFPKKMQLKLILKDILQDEVDEKYFLTQQRIEYLKRAAKTTFAINKNIENKTLKDYSRTITSGYFKGGRTEQFIVHSLFPRSSKTGKGGSGHLTKKDGTTYCVDTGNSQAIEKHNKIRRLTPLECWRLQGFTDEEFYKAQKVNSDTQLYKQAGNSMTVNVMMEILKKIYNELT